MFGHMIRAIEDTPATLPGAELLTTRLHRALDAEIGALSACMGPVVEQVSRALPLESARLLEQEHRRWADTTGWRLINAADPCGT
ncbi:hypothetical protein [Spongiactinospora sp. 9N601]|uniref:hypothetical protein n=1 Tax=Spongiactinospora sp. 9N601 TaxID=3375149 RepID=UPI0037A18EEC